MDLENYHSRRQVLQNQEKKYRELCLNCRQPESGCYCEHVHAFDPKIKFMILIHPLEVKRRIATGRMSSLCLTGSELIRGTEYSQDTQVNGVLDNPNHHCVVLYPGQSSVNLTHATSEARLELTPANKKLVIFVIDGTWSTAGKMIRRSPNLMALPRICFTPPGPSQFRIRRQPALECYSTIEAIHHTIELVGSSVGFDVESREHDNLMYVFNKMIEKHLQIRQTNFYNPRRIA